MTVAELIEHLKSFPQDAKVVTLDTDDRGIYWHWESSPPKLEQMVRLEDAGDQWHGAYFDPKVVRPQNIPSNISQPCHVVVIG